MDPITTKTESSIQVENYKLVWNIYNFNKMSFRNLRPIYGPTLELVNGRRNWTFLLYKITIDDQESLGFKLLRRGERLCWDSVKYSVRIQSNSGPTQICVENILTSGSEDEPWSYIMEPNFAVETKDILKSDEVTLQCAIEYAYHKRDDEIIVPQPKEPIFEDIKSLLSSNNYSDLSLYSEDNIEYKCHKSIVCARSFHFYNHFQERGQMPHVVLNFKSKIVHALLLYMYTSELPCFGVEDYEDLCKAAEYCFIPSLVKACRYLLKGNCKICFCPECKRLPQS